MDQVIKEIRELRERHELESARFTVRCQFANVMEELVHHSRAGRARPSNIKNRLYYGAPFYNWVLRYLGY